MYMCNVLHVFRAIWESRQSADSLGNLRTLRLPIGDLNITWTICDYCVESDCIQSRRVGIISSAQRFFLSSTLYILIFFVLDIFFPWDGAQGTLEGNFKAQLLFKEN